MEKIKVAICYSGLFRTFKTCYQGWKDNLFDCNKDFSFDVFCHTWDIDDNASKVKEFVNLYEDCSHNPVQVSIDQPIDTRNTKSIGWSGAVFDKSFPTRGRGSKNRSLTPRQTRWISGLRSSQLCNEMKNNSNIDYSLVLRVRTDHFIFTPIPLMDSWNLIKNKPNSILGIFKTLSLDESYKAPLEDRLIIGDKEGMDYLGNTYDYVVKNGCRTGAGFDSCERLLHRYIFAKGSGLNILKYKYDYYGLIIREDGQHKRKFDHGRRLTKKEFIEKYPLYRHIVQNSKFS